MTAILAPEIGTKAQRTYFNCRVAERRACELPTSCQPAAAFGSEETKWTGTILDLSPGGLRLCLSRRFEPGTGLAIELSGSGAAEARTVLVKVVHVKRQPGSLWSLGCKFISELSDDEVRRLTEVNRFEEEVAQEVVQRSQRVADVHLQVGSAAGTLVDCLVSRMNVPATWPLPAGTTVTVAGGKASGSPWKLQLQVLHCRRQGEGWLLHGWLGSAPSATALLQFLGQPTPQK